jgi:hypothetical protein
VPTTESEKSNRSTGRLFTLDINGRPTLVLEANDIEFARGICSVPDLRSDLAELTSDGVSICSENDRLVVRSATKSEIKAFKRAVERAPPSESPTVAFLIKVDGVRIVTIGPS